MAFLCRQSIVRGNSLVVSTSTVTGSVSSGGATAAEVEAVAGEKGGLFIVLCGVTVADGDDVQGRLGSKNI